MELILKEATFAKQISSPYRPQPIILLLPIIIPVLAQILQTMRGKDLDIKLCN